MEYKKENNRINVQFIDYNTEEVLFEIADRNWMNVGELFTDVLINSIAERELGTDNLPNKIMVLASVVASK